MPEELEYDYWKKEETRIRHAQGRFLYEELTKELHSIYTRKLEIIEDILIDLSPQRDDPQYSGTVSWGYEEELKKLDERQEELEPIIEQKIEQREHEEMLKDIGMTQEQYDAHLKQLAEERRKRRRYSRSRK